MKVIGICGGSGSGKTTLLNRLAETYSDYSPSVFSMDNYYKPIEEQSVDTNGKVNFDLPTALDKERLVQDLKDLTSGKSIEVFEYQFNAGNNRNVLITIEPSPLLIVEGLFVFEYEEVRELLDFSIFVDVDPAIQLDRRIYRDQESRGYSRSEIMYQWDNHVIPCYNSFLAPHETKSDFIYHNDSRSENDFLRLTGVLDPVLPKLK
ncbi:uridine kinase family protein [Brumimicrobium aurantiacum]|uniref:ATP-binding cassette domain-containing protein n=1 Tax=Brumimicrobium aurantiacum TaxID=1737063 RepID=A0A3E1F2A1_9FLAO|nr:ATP-binding cassette domain-containing protein [Brumimicrobium aurantiacum]RFC55837.1 ATP-binding cassette domain-containing protein [Brumimicrobium aurantiacum]